MSRTYLPTPPTFTHFIRLTAGPGQTAALLYEIILRSKGYLGCYETGSETEKPHCHIACELTVTWKALEKKLLELRKRMALTGNGHQSCKSVTDSEGLCRYVCKGDRADVPPTTFTNLPILPGIILRMQKDYYALPSSRKRKNKDSRSIIDVRNDCLKRLRVNRAGHHAYQLSTKRQIADVVAQECSGRYMYKTQYISMFNAVWSVVEPSQHQEHVSNLILNGI